MYGTRRHVGLAVSFLLIIAMLMFLSSRERRGSEPETTFRLETSTSSIASLTADWTAPEVPSFIQDKTAEDEDLADYIRDNWLLAPPPASTPRDLVKPDKDHYSQRGQSKLVDDLLKHRRDGFFVESGAGDGEFLCNSLFFEKSRNWTGLLVEPNPRLFAKVVGKRRQAYVLNACLSPTRTPQVLEFRLANLIGGLTGYMEEAHRRRIDSVRADFESTHVQCFPVESVLRALGRTHVDYFSLDIEGAELEVLQTFPFDRVTVDVLTVEYMISHDPGASRRKLAAIKELLVDKYGYKVVARRSEDVILIKR